MAEYTVIEDFQVKNSRVLSLDKSCIEDVYTKEAYIDGRKYKHIPNSVKQWIIIPGSHESFAGKTVVFK